MNNEKLINISELSKILDFIDPVTKKPQNHILRYWEREFHEIKPKRINKRRYYSIKQVEVIKMIKFLIKSNGMTILGVKKFLNMKTNKLDYDNSHGLKACNRKNLLKNKSKLILKKINKIKTYGKKNSS